MRRAKLQKNEGFQASAGGSFGQVMWNTFLWRQIGKVQSGVSPQSLRHMRRGSQEQHDPSLAAGQLLSSDWPLRRTPRRQGTGDYLAAIGHLALLQADAAHAAHWARLRKGAGAWGEGAGLRNKSVGSAAAGKTRWRQCPRQQVESLTYSTRACDAAAAHGHLDVLEWLYYEKGMRWTQGALGLALEYGQLPVVRWLHARAAEDHNEGARTCNCNCPARWHHYQSGKGVKRPRPRSRSCSEVEPCGGQPGLHFRFNFRTGALEMAAQRGHLAVLDWCERHGYLVHRRLSQCAVGNAAGNGHLEVVEWLVARGKPPKTPDALDNAAAQGHLQVVEWLHKRFGGQLPATAQAMDKAAQAGHLATVEWLHRVRGEGCTKRALDGAAQNGHLRVVRWLHHNRTEGATFHAMNWAARNGHLKIVEWLHKHRSEGCTKDAMDHAASAGWLNVVEWLHSNRTEGCSQGAMKNALQKKQADVIRWLCKNYQNECCLKTAVEDVAEAYENNQGSVVRNLYPDVSSLTAWLKENNIQW
eukprot:CAMPEP_0117737486 /NCGR_PEP_ID=MMETSP0947-20121206/2566_1 /TAXON_ID=44440 /ORGANISM="Chattonella subsalsa, Strain CCMP2191" /LENGTH=527 /DNA_ID=CAMNT_0005553001 /DNA_START=530 /DNA_END=2113 /DNA_ORIENTATION=+